MNNELKKCPFCGEEIYPIIFAPYDPCMPYMVLGEKYIGVKTFICKSCGSLVTEVCRKVPGRMRYGERKPKCSECGYSLGDPRWFYCPKCGGRIEK